MSILAPGCEPTRHGRNPVTFLRGQTLRYTRHFTSSRRPGQSLHPRRRPRYRAWRHGLGLWVFRGQAVHSVVDSNGAFEGSVANTASVRVI
jgi:hypothetical protein